MNINKEILAKICNAVDTRSFSEEEKDVFRTIKEDLFGLVPGKEAGHVEVLNMDNFVSRTLWSGEGDVRFMMDSGFLEDDYQLLMDKFDKNPAAYDEFVNNVTGSIDWHAPAFTSCEEGNAVILSAIYSAASAEMEKCRHTYGGHAEAESDCPDAMLAYVEARMDAEHIAMLPESELSILKKAIRQHQNLPCDAPVDFSQGYLFNLDWEESEFSICNSDVGKHNLSVDMVKLAFAFSPECYMAVPVKVMEGMKVENVGWYPTESDDTSGTFVLKQLQISHNGETIELNISEDVNYTTV